MISRIGVRTTNSGSAAAFLELIAGSLLTGFFLKELEVINAAATVQSFGLGKPQAIGVGPTTPVPLIPDDIQTGYATTEGTSKSASHVTSALAWGTTAPTVPLAFFARANLPATLGAAKSWSFSGQGIWVPSGRTIVLWGIGTNIASDVNVVVDERLA